LRALGDWSARKRARLPADAPAITFQVFCGWRAVNSIFTINLIPLKPYFHGVTSRSGAPFWLGIGLP